MKYAIVLTTNKNTFVDKMNSSMITCLHKIANKEMISYVLDALAPLAFDQLFIEDDINHQIANKYSHYHVASLDEIMKQLEHVEDDVLIVDARMPYLTTACIKHLLDANENHILTRYLASNDIYCIKEFMIIPKYRRLGIGKKAINLCFQKYKGNYIVTPSFGSETAYLFWKNIISLHTNNNYKYEDGSFKFKL